MPRRKKGPTVPDLVALLDNPQFRDDTKAVHQEAVRQHQAFPSQQDWEQQWPAFCERVIRPFVRKWAALPPPSVELVDSDPRREPVFAILTGRWGLIPVFPWTTEQDIDKRAQEIRRAIGKVHKDARAHRRARIVDWLELHQDEQGNPPPRRETAAAVWKREKGLRRPSKAQAVWRMSFKCEQELMRHYQAQGLSPREAERRTLRRARGSEPQASAMVRMEKKRHERRQREFMRELQSPQKRDPLGSAVTDLLEEILSGAGSIEAIQQKAANLRAVLATPAIRA